MAQGRGLGQPGLLKETIKYLKMAIDSMATEKEALQIKEGSVITKARSSQVRTILRSETRPCQVRWKGMR